MMNNENPAILVITSRLLAYPEKDEIGSYNDVYSLIDEYIESKALKITLKGICEPLFQLDSVDIKELYVATFDLKSKLGLYLTAHELGDSTKRGAALIKLQNVIEEAGFERDKEELVDYIPMLFEFLAVSPDSTTNERLYRRLAVAVQRIANHINKENPYAGVLQLLMDYVFPNPTKAEVKELEFNREEADLEELPYPIMYQ